MTTTTTNDKVLADALTAIAERGATEKARGKAAVSALLALEGALFERWNGADTEGLQRLCAVAKPYLKGGFAKPDFKDIKAFLVKVARLTVDAKGMPNAVEYERVWQAWKHDVRQGEKWLRGEKKGKGKGKAKPFTLDKALQAVKRVAKDLKDSKDFETWYRACVLAYCARTGATVPEEYRDKAAA